MTDDSPKCECIVDTDGLHGIATASGNLKSVLLDQLKTGVVAVPVCVWQEFELLYEEEAAELKPHVTIRINSKKAFYIGAARIADTLKAGFPRGAHDGNIELLTASIASIKSYRILTSVEQVKEYDGMGCEVSDLVSWVEQA
jgi:hypothetical protein